MVHVSAGPPCDPGRWACPSAVLTVASRRSPSQRTRGFSADPHPPLHRLVGFHGHSIDRRPHLSGDSWNCPGPRAPWHAGGVPALIVVSTDPVSQRDPAGSAPTGAGVRPQPSPCLRLPLAPRVCAGCGQPRLGGGPSRRDLCGSCPPCVDLDPGGSCGASTRFFPHDSGLPRVRTGAALHSVPDSDVRTPRFCGATVRRAWAGPAVCSPPRSLLPIRPSRMAAVPFPSQPLAGCSLPTPRICSPSASGP